MGEVGNGVQNRGWSRVKFGVRVEVGIGFRVRVRVEFGIEVKVGVDDITGTEVCGITKPNHNIGVGHAIDIGVAVGDRISVEVGIDVKVGVGDVIEIGVEVGV